MEKDQLRDYILEKEMDVVGFADPSLFQAPRGHNPTEILPQCQCVIVFGKAIPKGVFEAPDNRLELYMNAYERSFALLDDLALLVATKLEKAGFLAIPLPACTPLRQEDGYYRGILSLKQAAQIAGLGYIGKNYLLINSSYGPRLRLGGVLTTAKFPPDPPVQQSECPDGCQACLEACPPQAIQPDRFLQPRCFSQAVAHPLLKAASLFRLFPKRWREGDLSQLISNTWGRPFMVECMECLLCCPKYKLS